MSSGPSMKAKEYCMLTGLFKSNDEFTSLLGGTAAMYLHDPVVREAKRNKACELKWASRPYKVLALLIYITGAEAPSPCHLCSQKTRGYFAKCIVSRREGESNSYAACANCIYNGHPSRCSIAKDGVAMAPERLSSKNAKGLTRSPSFIEEDSEEREEEVGGREGDVMDITSEPTEDRLEGSDHERNAGGVGGRYPIRSNQGRSRRSPGLSAASVPNMKRASQTPSASSHLGTKSSRRSLPPSELAFPPRQASSRTTAIFEPTPEAEQQQRYRQEPSSAHHAAPAPDPFLEDFTLHLNTYRRHYENMSSEQRAKERVLRSLEITVIDAVETARKSERKRRWDELNALTR